MFYCAKLHDNIYGAWVCFLLRNLSNRITAVIICDSAHAAQRICSTYFWTFCHIHNWGSMATGGVTDPQWSANSILGSPVLKTAVVQNLPRFTHRFHSTVNAGQLQRAILPYNFVITNHILHCTYVSFMILLTARNVCLYLSATNIILQPIKSSVFEMFDSIWIFSVRYCCPKLMALLTEGFVYFYLRSFIFSRSSYTFITNKAKRFSCQLIMTIAHNHHFIIGIFCQFVLITTN